MKKKFHVNDEGRVMPCNAQSGNCPFGGDDQHFDSFEEAQLAADKKNEEWVRNKSTEVIPITEDILRDWISIPGFASGIREGKHPEIEEKIEKYIASQNGASDYLYRGISLQSEEGLKPFQPGAVVDMSGISSWTTFKDVAVEYTEWDNDDPIGVVFKVSGTRKGAKIDSSGEGEVVISKNAKWIVQEVTQTDDGEFEIRLVESF